MGLQQQDNKIIVNLVDIEDWNKIADNYHIVGVKVDYKCPNCDAELIRLNVPDDPFTDQMIYCKNGHRVVAKHAELEEEEKDKYTVTLVLEVLEHNEEWV